MRELTNEERVQYYAQGTDARILRRVLSVEQGIAENIVRTLVVIRDQWGWYVEVLATGPVIEAAWTVQYGVEFDEGTDVLGGLTEARTAEELDAVLLALGFTRVV